MIMSQSREVGVVEGREGEGGVGRGGGGKGWGREGKGGSLPTHIRHKETSGCGIIS